jgi:hypothetical protein
MAFCGTIKMRELSVESKKSSSYTGMNISVIDDAKKLQNLILDWK